MKSRSPEQLLELHEKLIDRGAANGLRFRHYHARVPERCLPLTLRAMLETRRRYERGIRCR